jgi:hypothetical protein
MGAGLIAPGSITAFAFIHVDDAPSVHVEHLSRQLERSTTEAALFDRVSLRAVNSLGDLLRPKQFHAHLPVFSV